jgi:dipeptidase E
MPVRLYLSSYRLGDHPEHLVSMVGGDRRRTVVIANAMDEAPEEFRRAAVEREFADLGSLGFQATELDLRDYFGASEFGASEFGASKRLRRELDGVALAWLRGGDVFMLRYVLQRSGGDRVLCDLLARDGLVYAGYSAGPCVLAPSLRGLEGVDDPDSVTRLYGAEPVWDGLAVLDRPFVPHCASPDHPESYGLDQVSERYQAQEIPHYALHDGQVLLVNGQSVVVV